MEKQLTKREISNNIKDAHFINAELREENEALRVELADAKADLVVAKADVSSLKSDSDSIKANTVITAFKEATKAQLLAKTVAEQREIMFKVLKALCHDALED